MATLFILAAPKEERPTQKKKKIGRFFPSEAGCKDLIALA